MAPLILPGHGMSSAAGTTTTTTTTNTTSASAEASTTNAIDDGDDAADSSSLFGEDEDVDDEDAGDHYASLFGENSQSSQDNSAAASSTDPIAAAANASVAPEAPRNVVAPVAEGAADCEDGIGFDEDGIGFDEDGIGFDEDDIDFSDDGEDDMLAMDYGNVAIPPAGPARAASPAGAMFPEDDAEDNTPAPAPAAPVKKGRGRPKNTKKTEPKTPQKYRCRYSCGAIVTGGVALRKHMMRVHCVFSSAHQNLVKCGDCKRTIDLNVKELGCVKRRGGRECPKDESELEWTRVTWPRDAQEEADTFAYENSGPYCDGPSRLVVVHDGDIEDVYREACRDAIKDWSPDGAATGRVLFKLGLPTPHATPAQQSFVDHTGDDEVVPATPTPAYQGKGKKRGADFSGPEPKRVMRQDSAMVLPQYTGFQAGVIPQAAPVNDGLVAGHDAVEMPVLDDFIVPDFPVMDAAADNQHFDMVFNDFQNEFPDFTLEGGMDFGPAEGVF